MSNHPSSPALPPRRILIRGTNWLGDAVMSTPALIRLREKFRGVHIALLSPEKLRDLWTLHPAVDEVVGIEPGESVFSVGRKLRAGRFDLAVVLPNSPRSAIEPWLAGIPRRVGYARPWRNWLLTQAVPTRSGHMPMPKRSVGEIQALIARPDSPIADRQPPTANPKAHQIHEYLHLVAALGANAEPMAPCLVVSPGEEENAIRKFGLLEAVQDARPILGLNPGAEYGPAKRWPVEKFIAAAQDIQRRTGCLLLVFGGSGDIEIAKSIESQIRNPKSEIRNLAGRTSLRELMSLLKLCRVLLTNDTGPMHVAAALGTPVVVPFGSTSPELTGPGLPGDPAHRLLRPDAPCAPCFLRECPIDFRCLNGLSVERVVAAVLSCGNIA